jgi:MFS family permease
VLGGLSISIWGIQTGIRVAFLVALATAIMAAIIQQILIDDTASDNRTGRSSAEKNPLRVYRNMSSQLKSLLVSDILIRFCEQIPYAFVVIWCTREIASPVSELQFGFLTAIEMATAVLVYIPVAYFADKSSKKPFVLLTFLFFTLFPLVLLFSTSFPLLVGAFILRGLKEFGEPTRKSLILDLSPADRRASMFGLYYLLRDTVVSVAAFGGAFLWQMSPGTNFLVAFGFGLLGSLWFAARGKDFSKLS